MVEEIDSKVINRKLQYLMKWKDFRVEHNSWEPWDYVNAPDLIAEFYRNHPEAARHIRRLIGVLNFNHFPSNPLKCRGVTF